MAVQMVTATAFHTGLRHESDLSITSVLKKERCFCTSPKIHCFMGKRYHPLREFLYPKPSAALLSLSSGKTLRASSSFRLA